MSGDGFYQQEAYDDYEREEVLRAEDRQDRADYFKDRLADVRLHAAEAQAERIAAWRVAHPEATGSDAVVLAIMIIEAIGQRAESR